MRIRATKPEFWRSKRITSLSWEDRLLLKGLESYVDDNGVGKDEIALIVGDVFSRDMVANPRDTLAKVSEGLPRLSEAGLLHRYEVEGTPLLFVAFWEEVQRIDKPSKGRMPRPDGTLNYGDSHIRESVARAPVTLAPGTGEQGNRGTGEQGGRTLDAAPLATPLKPFCKRHPEGTDQPCRGCAEARKAVDAATPAKPVLSLVGGDSNVSNFCPHGYPIGDAPRDCPSCREAAAS